MWQSRINLQMMVINWCNTLTNLSNILLYLSMVSLCNYAILQTSLAPNFLSYPTICFKLPLARVCHACNYFVLSIYKFCATSLICFVARHLCTFAINLALFASFFPEQQVCLRLLLYVCSQMNRIYRGTSLVKMLLLQSTISAHSLIN